MPTLLLTSSLLHTCGPLADIPTITSPVEFLIIAPNPEHFRFEKITGSKFSLYISCGGGYHTFLLDTVPYCKIFLGLFVILKVLSSSFVQAPSVRHLSSMTMTFLWFHSSQACTRKSSSSSVGSLSSKYSNRCLKSK